nr:uncharacterized protein LOC109162706 [Ipomoea trifida]
MVRRALTFWEKLNAANTMSNIVRGSTGVDRWDRPKRGRLKLNSDVAFDHANTELEERRRDRQPAAGVCEAKLTESARPSTRVRAREEGLEADLPRTTHAGAEDRERLPTALGVCLAVGGDDSTESLANSDTVTECQSHWRQICHLQSL